MKVDRHDELGIPLVIHEHEKSVVHCGADHIRGLFFEFGAMLFKSFDVHLEEFEELSAVFSTTYVEQAYGPLRKHSRRIAGELTGGNHAIVPHMERGYCPIKPRVCLFLGQMPAPVGGAFTFVNGAEIFDGMDASLRELFVATKIRFKHLMNPQAWALRYGTREQIETTLATDRSVEFCRFHDDCDVLEFDHVTTPVHHVDGRYYYVNSLRIMWGNTYGPLADRKGSLAGRVEFADYYRPISRDLVMAADAAVMRPLKRYVLKPGEVIILDNFKYMHGREAFEGPRDGKAIFCKLPDVDQARPREPVA